MNIVHLWEKCISNRVAVIGLLIVVFPVGLYCMWKGKLFSNKARWVITIFICWWAWNIFSDVSIPVSDANCTAVYESGGCTYYRDSNCNVIGRQCE